jgi:hypothetical protein
MYPFASHPTYIPTLFVMSTVVCLAVTWEEEDVNTSNGIMERHSSALFWGGGGKKSYNHGIVYPYFIRRNVIKIVYWA